jgi:hypothetical protein
MLRSRNSQRKERDLATQRKVVDASSPHRATVT